MKTILSAAVSFFVVFSVSSRAEAGAKNREAVTMRSGDLLTGSIQQKSLTITVEDNPIEVPFSRIAMVFFKSDSGQPIDKIQLVSGSSFSGQITASTLVLRLEDVESTITLQVERILTIQNTGH